MTEKFVSLPRLLFNTISAHPDRVKHYERDETGEFRGTTYHEFGESVLQFSKAMMALGFCKGERICIMGDTHARWTVSHFAAQCAGGVAAGIYMTSSKEQIEFILRDITPKFVVLDDEVLYEFVKPALDEFKCVEKVILMHGECQDEMVLSWEEFINAGESIDDSSVFERIDGITPTDVVTLIYTSGTTGVPKCVMMSSGNCEFIGRLLTETFKTAWECPEESDYVSYMPLCHVAEQVFAIFGPACNGGITNWFCPKISDFEKTLLEVRPHILFGPPLVWENFFHHISAALPPGVTTDQLDETHRHGIVSAIGLDRCKLPITGDAPVPESVLDFFHVLGMDLCEIYGQSEGTVISTNMPGDTEFGTIGKAVKDTEIKIAEDGEILYRGPQVFLGYWNLSEKTHLVIDDEGFVHSGDLGCLNENGYLQIKGRKNDIVKTSSGRMIVPVHMESLYHKYPLIEVAVVVGEARPYLNILIFLDPEVAKCYAEQNGQTLDEFSKSEQAQSLMSQYVDEVNQQFILEEQVQNFKILLDHLSVEKGTMTSTMKVKRFAVYEYYSTEIKALYDQFN